MLVFLQDPLLFASIKSARIAEQAVIAARAYIGLVEKISLAIARSSRFLLRSILKLPRVSLKNIGWEADYCFRKNCL